MEVSTRKGVRERAYLIWERAGRPHGRSLDHWLQAEAELAEEDKPAKKRQRSRSRSGATASAGPKKRGGRAAATSRPR